MNKIIECVPNFSEGRDKEKIEKIVDCFRNVDGVKLLDYSSDEDHNRSVVTVIGEPAPLKDAMVAAIGKAVELIDMTKHQGQHPRMGCVDVVPFIPIRNTTVEEADALAKEAAFFSIGTNDLTGYTMAVDRGNAKVAYLYSTYNPAVLRAIKRIIECGKKEGIMVGMCGEAAADSKLIPLLLAFGLDEFSVSATSVLKTRKTISDCTMDECKALADKVMACVTEEEVLGILG